MNTENQNLIMLQKPKTKFRYTSDCWYNGILNLKMGPNLI